MRLYPLNEVNSARLLRSLLRMHGFVMAGVNNFSRLRRESWSILVQKQI